MASERWSHFNISKCWKFIYIFNSIQRENKELISLSYTYSDLVFKLCFLSCYLIWARQQAQHILWCRWNHFATDLPCNINRTFCDAHKCSWTYYRLKHITTDILHKTQGLLIYALFSICLHRICDPAKLLITESETLKERRYVYCTFSGCRYIQDHAYRKTSWYE